MATKTDEQGNVDNRNQWNVGNYLFLQRIRIIFSFMCFTLCVLFLTFGMRSHYEFSGIQGRLSTGSHFIINFRYGLVTFNVQGLLVPETHATCIGVIDRDIAWKCHTVTVAELIELLGEAPPIPVTMGFFCSIQQGNWGLGTPSWFLVLVTCLVGCFLKPMPRMRLQRRDLMIVATLAALTLVAFEILV